MLTVGRVPVTVVEIIDMISVLDGVVSAIGPVRVLVRPVLGDRLVLVVVIPVQCMTVGAVHVVHVITVLDGLMTASVAMLMFGDGVLRVNIVVAHAKSSFS